MNTFRRELIEVINKHSKENGSDTPDFILAEYLTDCLRTFDKAINLRENWYNRKICGEVLKEKTPEELQKLVEIFRNNVTDTTKFNQTDLDKFNVKVKNTLDNRKPCPDCGGEGYTFFVNQGEPDPDSKCTTCNGTGVVPKLKMNKNCK
jgi:hypothetical protein